MTETEEIQVDQASEAAADPVPVECEPSPEELRAELTHVTKQRDVLLEAINQLKVTLDERLVLTQARLTSLTRNGE